MKFNLWLIVLFALAPVFILFAGLGAAGGFASAASWEVLAITAAAAFGVAFLAKRTADRNDEAASDEVAPTLEDVERELQAGYASPPCLMHEVDPVYLGYSSREEVLALLNRLLEAERAGVRGARDMGALANSAQARSTLDHVAHDEARFCAMLFGHITRLGETPTRRIGEFHERLAALPALDDRLQLLNRGQGWVVDKLREALPRIGEDGLREDLQEMLTAHQHNIDSCTRLVGAASPASARPA